MEQFPEFEKYSIVKKTNETITSYNTLTTNYFDNQKIKNMNDKKTAVEWLEEQLNPDMKTMQGVIIQELLEQAKAMEKEHIEDAFDTGTTDDDRIGKEYYNEKYGK